MSAKMQFTTRIKATGLQASYNRVRILQYLTEHPTHPTVDEIYTALRVELPSLSRTTVYNTLRAFLEKRLVRDVRIDEAQVRYDADMRDHAHFMCTKCQRVTDYPLELFEWPELPDVSCEQRDLFYRGCCVDCQTEQERVKFNTRLAASS